MKQSIGKRVRALRDEYRLTQTDFAAIVGLSYVAVGNIERGVTKDPSKETIDNIVNNFGTSYDWLMEGNGEMLPNGKVVFQQAGKEDAPWKDEAYLNIKEERTRLARQVEWFQKIIESNGLRFLKPVKNTA